MKKSSVKTEKKVKAQNKKTDFNSIKKLLKYAKPYLPAILLALVCSLIQIAATLAAPVVIGKTIDYIIGESNVNFGIILKNAGILGVLIAVAIIFQYVSSLLINFASYRTIRDLRRFAFKKLNDVPLSFIDVSSQGDLMSRVGNDVDQISDGLIQGFSQLFSGIVTIVGTLAFMLSYNWLLAVVVVLLTPLSLFVARFVARRTHAMFTLQSETRGELTALVDEMVGNQKLVKAFSYEDRAAARFDDINGRLRTASIRAIFFSSLTNPSTRFVNGVVYAFVGVFGALSAIAGRISVGQLACFLTYANQ